MVPTKNIKVFLIEDAPKIRAILIEVLLQNNIEVVGYAENQSDALAYLRNNEWDVVIVDISLKAGSGMGVLEVLNNDNKQYGKRVVFSGDASPLLKKRALALGADEVFEKSKDIDKLLEYVESLH